MIFCGPVVLRFASRFPKSGWRIPETGSELQSFLQELSSEYIIVSGDHSARKKTGDGADGRVLTRFCYQS